MRSARRCASVRGMRPPGTIMPGSSVAKPAEKDGAPLKPDDAAAAARAALRARTAQIPRQRLRTRSFSSRSPRHDRSSPPACRRRGSCQDAAGAPGGSGDVVVEGVHAQRFQRVMGAVRTRHRRQDRVERRRCRPRPLLRIDRDHLDRREDAVARGDEEVVGGEILRQRLLEGQEGAPLQLVALPVAVDLQPLLPSSARPHLGRPPVRLVAAPDHRVAR